MTMQTDITAAIYEALRSQAESGNPFAPMVTPGVGADQFNGTALIDGEVDLTAVADAIIAKLSPRG